MKKFLGKKSAVALSLIAALAIAVAAYAYWTSDGAGTASGTVGSQPADSITLNGSSFEFSSLGDTATISVTADNSASSSAQVTSVTVDSISADTPHADCNSTDHPDWFDLGSAVAQGAGGTNIAENSTGTALPNDLTVKLVDSSTENQDVCQGAQLTAHLSSNSL